MTTYKVIVSIFGHEHVISEGLSKEHAERFADSKNRKNPYIVYRVVRCEP
jgi:hypothetical protein